MPHRGWKDFKTCDGVHCGPYKNSVANEGDTQAVISREHLETLLESNMGEKMRIRNTVTK
jgi:hypothetical protein